MGTYTVETPSGAQLVVEADDEQSALEAAASQERSHMSPTPAPEPQQNYTPLVDPEDGSQVRLFMTPKPTDQDMQWLSQGVVRPPEQPMMSSSASGLESAGMDVLKSAPHYAETAVASFFGLPGDAIKAGRWLASKAGLPTTDKPVLGHEEIKQGIESVTGPLHEPETGLGKTVDIAAAILPAAFGGPGALATKLGVRVAAPAAVAGVAGEVADATGHQELRPWLEVAALLLTPFTVSKAVEPMLQGFVRKNAIPTTLQIRSLEKAQYKIANLAAHEVEKTAFETWADRLFTDYHFQNQDIKFSNPKTASVLSLMRDATQQQRPVTLRQLQEWRKMAGKAIGKDDQAAGLYAEINKFIGGLEPGKSLIGPDAAIAVDAMRKADALHVRYKNSQMMDKIYKIARTRMGRGYSRAGSETEGLQQKFEQLAKKVADQDSKEYRFFTPEMRDAIHAVSEGTPTLRALRALGSFVPWGMKGLIAAGFGPTSAASLALLGFGDLMATIAASSGLILSGAAIAGKAGAAVMTRRAADRAADLIRTGGKLPKSVPGPSPGVPAFGVPQVLGANENK